MFSGSVSHILGSQDFKRKTKFVNQVVLNGCSNILGGWGELIFFFFHQIHRSKNKWKFYLKDGVMSFEGKDHVFAKAIGDAEW